MAQAGVEAGNVYEDAASGKKEDRPGLTACLKELRRGDTLVIWKLDRLGRDLRHLVNLVDDLTQRHIGLKVLAGEGASIDTSTANGPKRASPLPVPVPVAVMAEHHSR